MVRSTSIETIPEQLKSKSGANPRSMNQYTRRLEQDRIQQTNEKIAKKLLQM